MRADDLADRYGPLLSRRLPLARGQDPRLRARARPSRGTRSRRSQGLRQRGGARLLGERRCDALRDEIELVRGAPRTRSIASAIWPGEQTPVFFGSAISQLRRERTARLLSSSMRRRRSRARRTSASSARRRDVHRLRLQDPGEHGSEAPRPHRVLRICSGKYRPRHADAPRAPRQGDAHRRCAHLHGGRPRGTPKKRSPATSSACTTTARSDRRHLHRGRGAHASPASRTSRRNCSAARVLQDPLKIKQLDKGPDQLCGGGRHAGVQAAAQQRLILGAVGALQFDVVAFRLKDEYGVDCIFDDHNVYTARWVYCDDEKQARRIPPQGGRQPGDRSRRRARLPRAVARESGAHHRALAEGRLPRHARTQVTGKRNVPICREGATPFARIRGLPSYCIVRDLTEEPAGAGLGAVRLGQFGVRHHGHGRILSGVLPEVLERRTSRPPGPPRGSDIGNAIAGAGHRAAGADPRARLPIAADGRKQFMFAWTLLGVGRNAVRCTSSATGQWFAALACSCSATIGFNGGVVFNDSLLLDVAAARRNSTACPPSATRWAISAAACCSSQRGRWSASRRCSASRAPPRPCRPRFVTVAVWWLLFTHPDDARGCASSSAARTCRLRRRHRRRIPRAQATPLRTCASTARS